MNNNHRRQFIAKLALGATGLAFTGPQVLAGQHAVHTVMEDGGTPLAAKKFVPVMVTPFKTDNSIDFDALAALADFYLSAGAKGLFANCLSSEMYSLNETERLSLARFVTKRVNGKVSVVATGSFGNSLAERSDFIKTMYHTGIQAVILITSHFAAAAESDEVLFANFEKILESTDNIPLGMYECPSPYKRIISPELFRKILSTNRFFYHKDTTLDITKIKAKIDLIGNNRLEFFDAHAPNTMASLQAGARGISAIAGNFYPEIFTWMCNNALNPKKQELVKWMQSEITRADGIVSSGYPTSAKYMLRKRGLPIQVMSRNGQQLSSVQTEALDNIYKDFLGWCEKLQIKPVRL